MWFSSGMTKFPGRVHGRRFLVGSVCGQLMPNFMVDTCQGDLSRQLSLVVHRLRNICEMLFMGT